MADIYLDQNEINQLQNIYNKQIANSSLDFRVEYYTTLKNFGISYGNLALGVVNDNTFSGQIANNFLGFDKTTLSDSQKIALSKDLLLRDFERRKANLTAANANGQDRISDLSIQDQRENHRVVYNKYNISLESWTPEVPIRVLGDKAGEILFDGSSDSVTKIDRIIKLAYEKGELDNSELLTWFGKTLGAAANTEEGTNSIIFALSTVYPITRLLSLRSLALTKYCFTAGTPILMSDGTYKPIEKVKVGDEVMAFDGLGDLQPRKVIQTFITPDREVVQLGNINVTLGHHFLQADGSFKALGEIGEDDYWVGVTGKLIPYPGIKAVAGKHTVYNFAVEELHTYVAGDYRVHNESLSLYQPVTTGGLIGASVGSQIASLYANDKFASQLVAQSLGKTLGSWAGDAIAYEFNLSDDPAFLARSQQSLSLAAIYKRLPSSFISTGISLGSSELSEEIIKTFKIEDRFAQFGVNSLTNGLTNYYITYFVAKSFPETEIKFFGAAPLTINDPITGIEIITNKVDLTKLDLAATLKNIGINTLASYIGSEGYQKLIKWNILSESQNNKGAQIGGTIGGFIFGPIGLAVGQIIGSVIGGIIGRDKDYPRAAYIVAFSNGEFTHFYSYDRDKGSAALADQMARAAKDTLNVLTAVVGGKLFGANTLLYGHYEGIYVYQYPVAIVDASRFDYGRVAFGSAQAAIEAGVLLQLKSVKIEGGDLYIKRLLATLPNINTIAQLNTDYQVAGEWAVYKDNPVLYDKAIDNLKKNGISDADKRVLALRSRPEDAFKPPHNGEAGVIDFGINVLPSYVHFSQGFSLDGKVVITALSDTSSNTVVDTRIVDSINNTVLRFADGSRFRVNYIDEVKWWGGMKYWTKTRVLVAEQVYNWQNNIQPRALALNLDTPQASDTYMSPNASQIVRNNGGVGNDILIASSGVTLNGGLGDDIYIYSRGQGTVTINDASGFDVIELDASIKLADLLFTKQDNNLIIAIKNNNSHSIKISDLPNKIIIPNYTENKIEKLRLSDNQEYIINYSIFNGLFEVFYFFNEFSGFEDLSLIFSKQVISNI